MAQGAGTELVNVYIMRYRIIILIALTSILFAACGTGYRVRRAARKFSDGSSLVGATIGISMYDERSGRYVYKHNADKYFIPASNVKILTCYLALKYLPDSLAGIEYAENDTAVFLFPTGDPTFLHPHYKDQPVVDFIRRQQKPLYMLNDRWHTEAFGSGWQWDDYNDAYSAERSLFPVYGNCIRWIQERSGEAEKDSTEFDQSVFIYSIPEVNMPVRFDPAPNTKRFTVTRDLHANAFTVRQGADSFAVTDVPFITNGIATGLHLISDSIAKVIAETTTAPDRRPGQVIYSRPLDSVLVPMMHRSDNFFAEQLLLMVSNRLTGSFNEAALIDSLLHTEFTDLPGKPRWVDGSGLSRYNLFSPAEFVNILRRTEQDFTKERVAGIYASAGTGTLSNLNIGSNKVIAKTGTMSGVVALSGYLLTASGKRIVFSILINNHRGSAVQIRNEIARMLAAIR